MWDLLQTAAAYARKRKDNRGFFVGAIGIRYDGRIVHACNSPSEKENPWCHAEAKLVRKLGKNSPVVFVARYSPGVQGLAMAKPCPSCEAILRAYGVKQVIYSTGPDSFDKMTL